MTFLQYTKIGVYNGLIFVFTEIAYQGIPGYKKWNSPVPSVSVFQGIPGYREEELSCL